MLSLLVMIQRAQNNDFYNYKDKIDCYPKVLDGCYLPPLTVLWFVQKVFEIVCLEDNEWAYDYGYHNMKRDYALWKRLVASSNNVQFNHNNLWSSFAKEGNKAVMKKQVFGWESEI